MRYLDVVGLALAALPQLSRADDAPKGRQYALLVGVRNYTKDELHSLPYTENDVTELGQVLRDAGYKRVVVMTQSEAVKEGDNQLLPEGRHVRHQLDALLQDRQPDDTVLIAFSGHGVQPTGKSSYFCPMDAQVQDLTTLIRFSDVYKALDLSNAGMKLLLVDACRNDPLVGSDRAVDRLKMESVARPQAVKPPDGVAALFSCSEGQRSFESEEFKHGVFFHYVIEGLKGEAANKKGAVGLTELARYVFNEVPDQAQKEWGTKAQQVPQLTGDVTGSAPLATRLLDSTP